MRFQKILNSAFAENFSCLSQKLVNPFFYVSSYFLFGIPFSKKLISKKKSFPEKLISFFIFRLWWLPSITDWEPWVSYLRGTTMPLAIMAFWTWLWPWNGPMIMWWPSRVTEKESRCKLLFSGFLGWIFNWTLVVKMGKFMSKGVLEYKLHFYVVA